MKFRYLITVGLAWPLLVAQLSLADGGRDLTLAVDEVVLHGTLLDPGTASDLVIVHPGSGPSDRDGNQPGMRNDSLRLLAEALAAANLAVLRYDKRGVGESRTDQAESDLRPSHYINDLAAWATWARREGGFERVVLLGHSEGALFAKAAALRVDVDAVISLAGSGRPIGVLLLEQTEGRRPGEIDQQFRDILTELEAGRQVEDVPPVLATLFRPSVQPYLIEWLALDPAELAKDLAVPLLVVAGSTDLQVVRADFDALAESADRAVWIVGMNHVLRDQDGPLEQQVASYLSADAPLHADLVPALLQFLQPTTRTD